ncbi:MobA/MobL family protein, partial [Fundidesulfovibrio putealis]|uniref:MobA/MobL family protein n=1 Tax=Fundidesulfovibrio putealis TaxID=270496 RepID=UPI00146FA6A8
MAIYHCNISNVGKASGSACAKHQYVTREGKYAFGEGEESDLAHTHSANMPRWAEENPQAYWKAADEFSRANAQVCKEVRFALPRELNREQQIELARSYAQRMSQAEGGRHPYTLGIHDDGTNPHAHLQLSASINDGIEREPEQWFKRYNGKTPERGGARRSPDFHDKEFIERARVSWEQEANQALERAGHEARISRLTLEEQGIERTPQIHVGYRDPARPEVHDMRSARNMDIQAGNARHVQEVGHLGRAEQELATLNRELEAIRAKQAQEQGQGLRHSHSQPQAQAPPLTWEEMQAQLKQQIAEMEKKITAMEGVNKPQQAPHVAQQPKPGGSPKPQAEAVKVEAPRAGQNQPPPIEQPTAHVQEPTRAAQAPEVKPEASQAHRKATPEPRPQVDQVERQASAAKVETPTPAPSRSATSKPETDNQVKATPSQQKPFKSEAQLNEHIKNMDAEIVYGKPVVSEDEISRMEKEFKVFEKQAIEKEDATIELGKYGIEWCESAHKTYQSVKEYQKQEAKMKGLGAAVERASQKKDVSGVDMVKYEGKNSALKAVSTLYNVAHMNLKDCAVNLCKNVAYKAVENYLAATCPGASLALAAVRALGLKKDLVQAATPVG